MEDIKTKVYSSSEVNNRPNYIRLGQAVYNYCYKQYGPDILNKIPQECDCFYDSNKVELFLDELIKLIK